jgi:transcription-repair coupling factor (superfamily II helicase)
MEMYKKISQILSTEDAEDITDEFIDRFGDMPKPVVRLISVALVKALAERAGISRVEARDGTLTLHTGKPDLAAWSEVFSTYRGMRFAPSGDKVIYKYSGEDPSLMAREILAALFAADKKEKGEEAK